MDDAARDELLVRLDERTDAIMKRLEKGDACMDNHEKRISKLESFQAQLLALAAGISFAVTLVWDKLGKFWSGS